MADGSSQSAGTKLVDDFEAAFQNTISTLTSHEYYSTSDAEESKTTVDQSIQRFLDVAKQLEAYFLQKRLILSIQRPEQYIKEDIQEMRNEINRKDQLLKRHYEMVNQWQARMNQSGIPVPVAMAPGLPTQASVPNQTQMPQPMSQAQMTPQQVPQQHPNMNQSQQFQHQAGANFQGPLAYLEQTTSSIGINAER